MYGDGTCALRERLVLTAMGIAAAGCSSGGEPSVSTRGEASATAIEADTVDLTIAPVANATPVETNAPPAAEILLAQRRLPN